MIFLLRFFVGRRLVREWLRTGLAMGGIALGVAVYLAIRIANVSVLSAFSGTVDAIAGKANLEISASSPGLDERIFPRVLAVPGVRAAAPLVEIAAPLLPGSSGAARGGLRAPLNRRPTLHLESPALFVLGIDPFRQAAFGTGNSQEASGQQQANGQGTGSHTSVGSGDSESLEFLTDPRAVDLSVSASQSLHAALGSRLSVIAGAKTISLHVIGVLPEDPLSHAYGGKIGVMDIAGAQEAFGRLGRLDRILVETLPGAADRVIRELRRILPASAAVQRPSRRTATVERMLGAFQLNLEALSLIALFVGMFLIYNTLSAAVVRRRGEIGILLSLGLSRPRLFALVLAEAAILGVCGSGLGLAVGCGMARGLLSSVATTVSSLYVRVEVEKIHAPASLLIAVWLIGVGASLIAAMAPAIEAAGVQPAQVTRQGSQVRLTRLRWSFFAMGSVIFLAIAPLLSAASVRGHVPWLSFAAAFSVLFGFSLLSPVACLVVSAAAAAGARRTRGATLRSGTAFLRESLERVWVVAAALSAAIAMLVGLSTMIGSFRQTVDQWVGQTVIGDLYVAPAALPVSGSAALLPAGVAERAARIPGVAMVDRYRFVDLTYGGRAITLTARSVAVIRRHPSYHLRHGGLAGTLQLLARGRGVLVSDVFAELFRLREGDTFSIPTPGGIVPFEVAGIFPDYSSDQGILVIDLDRYRKLWHDSSINSMALYAAPGVSDNVLADRSQSAFRDLTLNIRTNGELRREILRIFDQTFRVTYGLETVAVIVALLGIASTLVTLVLQRLRQFATLRALGASRTQVAGAVMVEAGLIGGTAWMLGSLCGIALAAELIYVVLPEFFHWTVELAFHPEILAWSLALILPASAAAAVLPALSASRVEISRALRTE